MLMGSKGLAVVLVVTAFGVFGMPERAKADAITLGGVSQVPGKLQINGKGTFSVNQGRKLKSITMKVYTIPGTKQVSSTAGTVPQGTTEWSSNSDVLPAGTYLVNAVIATTQMDGSNEISTDSQNAMQITIK